MDNENIKEIQINKSNKSIMIVNNRGAFEQFGVAYEILDLITNLQQENEKYKKIFEAKERFSKIMPEDTDFIILRKADYDRQQEDIGLELIDCKSRIDKAVEYIKNNWYQKNTRDIEHCVSFGDIRIDLLNILTGGSYGFKEIPQFKGTLEQLDKISVGDK